jgi:hypothetical protein
MKHLYIVVEGETELEFIRRLLIPYLESKGLTTNIQGLIVTMKGGGHGFNNIEHFKKTIQPLLSYKNEPVITTMIDHYGINSDKKLPNYSNCIKEIDIEKRISCMEQSLWVTVQSIKKYPYFIPNILRHEMETLLFAAPEKGFYLEKDEIKNEVLEICACIPNIEDINCTPEGAPSKRLIKIYSKHNQRYNKVAIGVDIAELTGIDEIIKRSPRFKSWIDKLIHVVTRQL